MTTEQGDQGFKITDKRMYGEDGKLREPLSEEKAPDASKETAKPGTPPRKIPQIDFPSYILSYYTQGLVLLGEVPNPYTNKKEEDLEAARHTVDILAMLEEKTRGNLSKEEEQLLGSVLYELRMKFMAKANEIKL